MTLLLWGVAVFFLVLAEWVMHIADPRLRVPLKFPKRCGDPMLVSPQVRIATEDRYPELNASQRGNSSEFSHR